MNTFQDVLSLSGFAGASVVAYQVVGFDDAPTNADDVPVKGVAQNPAEVGDAFAVIALGTVQVTVSGAIAKGDAVISAGDGRVKRAVDTSKNVFARALTDAADGQLVDILIR